MKRCFFLLAILLSICFSAAVKAQEILIDDFNDSVLNQNNLGGFTGFFIIGSATAVGSLVDGGLAITFSRPNDQYSFSGFVSQFGPGNGTVNLIVADVNQLSFHVKGETVNGQPGGGQNFQIELIDAQGRRLKTALTNVPGLETGAAASQWGDVNIPLSAMLPPNGEIFDLTRVREVVITFNSNFTPANTPGATSRIMIDDLKFTQRQNPPTNLFVPDPNNPDVDVIAGSLRFVGPTDKQVLTVAEDPASLRGTALKIYYDVSETGDDFGFVSFRPSMAVDLVGKQIKTVKFRARSTGVNSVPTRLVLELKQGGMVRGTVLVYNLGTGQGNTTYGQTLFPIYSESSFIDEVVIVESDGGKGSFMVDQLAFSSDPYTPNTPAYEPSAGPPVTDEELLDYIQARTAQYFVDQIIGSAGLVRDRSKEDSPSSIAATGFGLSVLTVIAQRFDPNPGSVWHITAADGTVLAPAVAEARVRAILDQLLIIQSQQPDLYTGQGDPQRQYGIAGFFYHFMNADGTRAGQSEVSVIDTAILLIGALQAGEYFGSDIRTKADQLIDHLNWDFVFYPYNFAFRFGWMPEQRKGFRVPDPAGIGFLSNGLLNRPSDELLLINLLALAKDPTRTEFQQAFFAFPRVTRTYVSKSGERFPVVNSFFGSGFTYLYAQLYYPFERLGQDRPDLIKAALAYPVPVNWWTNGINAVKANRQFAIDRSPFFPFSFNEDSWGLSAVERPDGIYEGLYGASPAENGPSHDGTVAPYMMFGTLPFFRTAASDPVSENASFQAMRHGYEQLFNNLFGQYGPVGSFNDRAEFSVNFLGLDQGPIVLSIENYRSGMVWNTFARNAKIQAAIDAVFGHAPQITPIPEQTVAVNQILRVEVTATDTDGDPDLRISADNLPQGATLEESAPGRVTFTWTPGPQDVGTRAVNFTARDRYRTADQPTPMVIIVTAAGNISGRVSIQGRTNQSAPITFELRNPGQTLPLKTFNLTTNTHGDFNLNDISPGTYDLTAKSSNTLRAKRSNITVTAGQTTSNINFNLLGGDADNNNVVFLVDFAILRAAKGTKIGDPKWDPRADFNGNGQIDLADFAILRANFGKSGAQ